MTFMSTFPDIYCCCSKNNLFAVAHTLQRKNPLKVDSSRMTPFYWRKGILYFTLLLYVEERTIDAGCVVYMVVVFGETFTQKSVEHDIDTWKESIRKELPHYKWSPKGMRIIWHRVLTVNLWTYESRECRSLENFPLEQRYDHNGLAQLCLWWDCLLGENNPSPTNPLNIF